VGRGVPHTTINQKAATIETAIAVETAVVAVAAAANDDVCDDNVCDNTCATTTWVSMAAADNNVGDDGWVDGRRTT
jgi:hypothetical protein